MTSDDVANEFSGPMNSVFEINTIRFGVLLNVCVYILMDTIHFLFGSNTNY